jgi:ketosteroid isomerase-like protein
MSQQNVDVVRGVLAAWSAHRERSVLRLLDPEIVFDATRRKVNPKTYVGMEGLRVMLADRDEVWDEFHTEPDEFIDAGDRIVVVGRWIGKGKGSGIEVEQHTAHVFTLSNGRVVRWELGHADRGQALEAVGLSE